jgi:secreted PhoX family phosphatase
VVAGGVLDDLAAERENLAGRQDQFAAGDFGSGFPDYNGAVPRSATIVITREDGGIIGA